MVDSRVLVSDILSNNVDKSSQTGRANKIKDIKKTAQDFEALFLSNILNTMYPEPSEEETPGDGMFNFLFLNECSKVFSEKTNFVKGGIEMALAKRYGLNLDNANAHSKTNLVKLSPVKRDY